MNAKWSHPRGLVLRDILIAMAVVGLLLAILIPYLYQRQVRSRRDLCEFRQIKMALAVQRYVVEHGRFPGYRNLQAETADGKRHAASWVFPLLPYIDYDAQKKAFGPYNSIYQQYGPQGKEEFRGKPPRRYIRDLVCPADPPPDYNKHANWMSWSANCGMPDAADGDPPDWPANGVFMDAFARPQLALTIEYLVKHDGAQATLLLSENVDGGGWTDTKEFQVGFVWIAELDGDQPPSTELLTINRKTGQGKSHPSYRFARPSSWHVGGANAAYCAGNVRFLNEDIDYVVFAQSMTSNDTELMQPGSNQPIGAPFARPKPKHKSNSQADTVSVK